MEQDQIQSLLLHPTKGMPRGKKTFFGFSFENAFSGKELLAWLIENCQLDKSGAKTAAAQLLKAGFISHCSSDRLPFTEACFYQFASEKEKKDNKDKDNKDTKDAKDTKEPEPKTVVPASTPPPLAKAPVVPPDQAQSQRQQQQEQQQQQQKQQEQQQQQQQKEQQPLTQSKRERPPQEIEFDKILSWVEVIEAEKEAKRAATGAPDKVLLEATFGGTYSYNESYNYADDGGGAAGGNYAESFDQMYGQNYITASSPTTYSPANGGGAMQTLNPSMTLSTQSTIDEVYTYLSGSSLNAIADNFRSNDVDGEVFFTLSESDLSELGCNLGQRKKFILLRQKLLESKY